MNGVLIWLSRLLDLVLPRRCLGCGRGDAYLCPACAQKLPPAHPDRGAPNLIAAFDYHDARVKQAIWLLKYRGGRQLAETFAAALYPLLLEALAEAVLIDRRPWLVVPIPLTKKRERRRGFNQAAVIAEQVAKREPQLWEFAPRLLSKTRDTAPQASLRHRAARLENVRGVFHMESTARVSGRAIILVDDVITTGATTSEAARVLVAAGAASVLVLAAARD